MIAPLILGSPDFGANNSLQKTNTHSYTLAFL